MACKAWREPGRDEDAIVTGAPRTSPFRISTIIATCNRPRFLVEALDSLAAQSLPPVEVLVVDDGSASATRSALQRWQAVRRRRDFVLRYCYQANSGPAVARNRGIAAASGDCLHFMDDDDLMDPGALLHLATALAGRDDAAVAMARHARVHEGEAVAAAATVAPCALPAPRRLAAMIAGSWFVPIHGYLFTRAAVARMGPWDPALASQEDDEWLLRAALREVDFRPAPAAVVYYREHDGVRRATPGKPGETVVEGRSRRLRDDLAIRRGVALELLRRGCLAAYEEAFDAWRLRLCERYGDLLAQAAAGGSPGAATAAGVRPER